MAVVSADGTGFASPVIKQDRTAANLAAGVTAGRSNWVLFARYSADVSGNWVAQTGQAGLSVKF